MTELDWLNTNDHPWDMLAHLEEVQINLRQKIIGFRRWRLFHCACCRRIWSTLTDPRFRLAIEVAERYADGQAGHRDLDAVRKTCSPFFAPRQSDVSFETLAHWAAYSTLNCELIEPFDVTLDVVNQTARDDSDFAVQCNLLRDIFGNPFKPPSPCPQWDNGNIARLAQAAYDERNLPEGTLDPKLLCALAAAIEESGGGGEMVEHLRGPGPHVRGCWVLDLVLGRA